MSVLSETVSSDNDGNVLLLNSSNRNTDTQSPLDGSTYALSQKGTCFWPVLTLVVSGLQVVVFLLACLTQGVSPISSGRATRFQGIVQLPNLTVTSVCSPESENRLLGPTQRGLLRVGAFYPPCMRHNEDIQRSVVDRQNEFDRASGCCLLNEGRHCYQSDRTACRGNGSLWLKNPTVTRVPVSFLVRGRIRRHRRTNQEEAHESGPVCGLDPNYCLKPPAVTAVSWTEKDVTQWPICERMDNVSDVRQNDLPHLQCEVTGRPCCLGILGECIITTQQHCDFVRGYFNPQASLCSQVNCLQHSCGMLPFNSGQYANHIFRGVTSLFVHYNVVHLFVTLVVQLTFMRKLEVLLQWHRLAAIYIFSGCFGNLLSGYLIPYQLICGPTGSLMSLAAVRLLVHSFHPRLRWPLREQAKNLFLVLGLFTLGLLPWLDSLVMVGGFVSGLLLTLVFLPVGAGAGGVSSLEPEFESRGWTPAASRCRDPPLALVPLLVWFSAYVILTFLFIFGPIVHCPGCTYVTCIALASGWCDAYRLQATQLTRTVCTEYL